LSLDGEPALEVDLIGPIESARMTDRFGLRRGHGSQSKALGRVSNLILVRGFDSYSTVTLLAGLGG
jgi:hypothetical protein